MNDKDNRGGNMLIPDTIYEINKEDINNIEQLISRQARYVQILEEQDPFSMELEIEHKYAETLKKIEKLLKNENY